MPQRMFCCTVMFGKSAYCWNRYPTQRRWGGRLTRRSLSKSVSAVENDAAAVGVMMPAMHLSVTLLAAPDAPSKRRRPVPVSNCTRE